MRTLAALFVALAAFAAPAAAQTPVAGIEYRDVGKPAGDSKSVEVVEFFWYRCPHCYALEPLLERWLTKLPAEVQFRRVPAVLGREWVVDARIYYALEVLGEAGRLHRPLLDAIHLHGGKRLSGDAYLRWVTDWLGGQGIDLQAYKAASNSREVQERVSTASDLAKTYQLESTPSFVVGERYVVSPPIGERRRILDIAAYLVSRVQAETVARR
jgi:thiol:disulfide interchange protein DsbA